MGRRCNILLRRCHNVPIKCRGDLPLRGLGKVPPRRRWVIHLRRNCNVAATYKKTSLQRRYGNLLSGSMLARIKLKNS